MSEQGWVEKRNGLIASLGAAEARAQRAEASLAACEAREATMRTDVQAVIDLADWLSADLGGQAGIKFAVVSSRLRAALSGEGPEADTGCSEEGCPGLANGKCPNDYGETCGAIFPHAGEGPKRATGENFAAIVQEARRLLAEGDMDALAEWLTLSGEGPEAG